MTMDRLRSTSQMVLDICLDKHGNMGVESNMLLNDSGYSLEVSPEC